MALTFRVIARLDIRNEHAIQPIQREGVRPIGDPQKMIARYDTATADEFFLCDCVASLYGRSSLYPLVLWMTEHAFCPVTVAGGIARGDDVRALLNAGADKIAINSAALANPKLLDDLVERFGSSTIALQLDAKRHPVIGWVAYTHGGRQHSGRDAISWAREAVQRGVGEVIVTAIDKDGMQRGMDFELLAALADLPVPVVLSGGCATADDAFSAYQAGASGVAIGAALHKNQLSIPAIKQHLKRLGVPVRCESLLPEPGDS